MDCWCRIMTDRKMLLRAPLVVALIALSALTLRGSNADHRAHLSDDLVAHVQRHTWAPTRVIVPGSDADIDALAERHHLQIIRRLANGAVLAANSAELADLASDVGVDHLSGDATVHAGMAVSSKATAADQVWSGQSGLLGLGSI